MNELNNFLKKYEEATNSHNFNLVEPLLAENAVYWFSDGSYDGLAAIRDGFESTWNTVKNEVYEIHDVRWLTVSDTSASCVYRFAWRGIIEGKAQSGEGRGTNVLTKTADGWKIVHEHLS